MFFLLVFLFSFFWGGGGGDGGGADFYFAFLPVLTVISVLTSLQGIFSTALALPFEFLPRYIWLRF